MPLKCHDVLIRTSLVSAAPTGVRIPLRRTPHENHARSSRCKSFVLAIAGHRLIFCQSNIPMAAADGAAVLDMSYVIVTKRTTKPGRY